ncbi:MAG: aspartyl protease family protein [bacterium]|nr:aspartyl protease family protein [bacterium]
MGTFTVTLGVADPQGRRYEEVEAMVDSGATYTVLPASILERLGVTPHDSQTFVLADGSRVERGFGQTWMRLDRRERISPVVFWDEHSLPLLGAVTLEIFGLGVDPVNGRLMAVDAFMLAADASTPLGRAPACNRLRAPDRVPDATAA